MALFGFNVDPKIWRVIAGPCSEFPTANSMVYYFPQGHVDEASAPLPIDLSRLITQNPYILCKVTAVSYHANPSTDEVMANLRLTPLTPSDLKPLPVAEDNNKDGIVSYVKKLQSSEVFPFEDGHGQVVTSCFVPDALAELIFPLDDLQAEYQAVCVTDLMGKNWYFRHYHKSNLIKDGWREFARAKKLLAGDAVVFVKKDSLPGKIFVGIRRAQKAKAPATDVADQMDLAFKGFTFKVQYTPSPGSGWCDFVVRSHIVEESMSVCWWPFETRVMMPLEIGALSRVFWIRGKIIATIRNTPLFRDLLIEWDQPGITSLQRVSPWQLRPIFKWQS